MTYRDMLMGLGPPPIKLGAKMTPQEVQALLKSLEKPAPKRKLKVRTEAAWEPLATSLRPEEAIKAYQRAKEAYSDAILSGDFRSLVVKWEALNEAALKT